MQQYAEPVTDKKGNAIAGAQVSVYNLDGSLASLFAADGVTSIANPVTTSTDGIALFSAANGNYTRTVTASGSTFAVPGQIALSTPGDTVTSAQLTTATQKATRDIAKDAMSAVTISSPLNVSQQIAATIPPGGRILQFGSLPVSGPLSGTSTDSGSSAIAASTPLNVYPLSPTSRLLVFCSLYVEVTAEAADTLINTVIDLKYYTGSAYSIFTQTQKICVGGASNASLRIHGSAAFVGELAVDQRRTDSQGQWTLRPYIQSVSGASWALGGGQMVFIEIDDSDTTSAADSVEDLVHFISYGQSLGAGSGNAAKTTTAVRAGRALMPIAGVRPLGAQTGSSQSIAVTGTQLKKLVNLLEQTVGGNGETPSSAAAYKLTDINALPSQVAVAVSNHSIGGMTIAALSYGTVPYANLLATIARTRVLARRNGLSHRAGAMWFTQGEADRSDVQSTYLTKLVALQAALTTDVRAIDRGAGQFPVFIDQLHNWTSYTIAESEVPFAQLQAAIDYPGKFYLVGPKYMLQTVGDGTHLTADSSAWLGAYQGEIARRVLVLGEAWLPLHITSAVRSGTSVILTYRVPSGSLVFDTTLVSDPGNKGYRFFQAGGNSVTVTGATITGAAQVTLTLSDVPTGTAQTIGYADIGTAGNGGGPLTGPRGNLRDQAPATGLYGETLYNWAVVQRKAIN
jgi:hypothetical protein